MGVGVCSLPLLLGFLLLTFCMASSAAQAAAAGQSYYVAVGGNDTSSSTLEQPWRTVQYAADTLLPGDTVYIQEGVYQRASAGDPFRHAGCVSHPGCLSGGNGDGGWGRF